MTDIMIDLETLGTDDGAAIIQIGVCSFDIVTNTISEGQCWNVDWESTGFGDIGPSTLKWWLDQDPKVRNEVFNQSNALSMREVLRHFTLCVREMDFDSVWAKGADFDSRLLRQAYSIFGWDLPYPYYKVKDMRTVLHTFGEHEDVPPKNAQAHNALADAQHQARHLMNIVRRIKKL